MKLRRKIILFALAPLMLALCTIAITVYNQGILLGKEQREVIEPAYLAGRGTELKGYVMLAKHAISHLYGSGRRDGAVMAEAKAILARLDYGSDGYFFVYDLQGNLLVHSRKPELVDQNRLDYRDINGYPTIQMLIRQANEGGGFIQYATEKPSTGQPAVKLTYVLPLPDWGWVLGTGLYLDDVEEILAKVDGRIADNNNGTLRWIGAITFLCMAVVIFFGLMLNIRERRAAQEEERARVAAELHDGICQKLGALKLRIETGIMKLAGPFEKLAPVHDMLEETAEELNEVVIEVRGIAHGLYPESLIDLGLEAALRQLALDMTPPPSPIDFTVAGETGDLPDASNLALYRVAQEALTNIKRHAGAQRISMQLKSDHSHVTLTICDDGAGFDPAKCKNSLGAGIGLRNMKRRLEAETVDGELTIMSSQRGTRVVAKVPRTLRNNLLIDLWPLNRK